MSRPLAALNNEPSATPIKIFFSLLKAGKLKASWKKAKGKLKASERQAKNKLMGNYKQAKDMLKAS